MENREAILRDARRLTGHSPRPTIPTAMALGGSDSLPIQLQGKWKSQGMVQKYIRDRGGVVLSSVRQIAAGLREAWEKEEVVTQTGSQEPADRERGRIGQRRTGPRRRGDRGQRVLGHVEGDGCFEARQDRGASHRIGRAGATGVQHGSHGLLCPAR